MLKKINVFNIYRKLLFRLTVPNYALSLLARLFLCREGWRNISSRFCHCELWAALQSQGRQQSKLPGVGKKKSKGNVKNSFWPRKIRHVTAVPLVYLRVLAYLCGREI